MLIIGNRDKMLNSQADKNKKSELKLRANNPVKERKSRKNQSIDKPEKILKKQADAKKCSDMKLKANQPAERNESEENIELDTTEKSNMKIKDINSEQKQILEGKKSFEWEDVVFYELDNGNIKCGICQTETVRLLTHMNISQGCGQGFNMVELKVNFTKHRAKMRKRKQLEKQKADEFQKFRLRQTQGQQKHEEKKKAEDLKSFKDGVNKRKMKQEEKQKNRKLRI